LAALANVMGGIALVRQSDRLVEFTAKARAMMLYVASGTSDIGPERTNQAGLALSVVRGRPEVKLRGRQDRC